MKKKLLITILLLCLPFKVYSLELTNYNEIKLSESQISSLKSLGFNDEQIMNMDYNEFEANKNLTGQIMNKQVKYFKTIYINYLQNKFLLNNNSIAPNLIPEIMNFEITEEEYNNSQLFNYDNILLSSSNSHETTYKKITTSIIAINGRYRYKNDIIWKIMPSNRSYDVHGILHDSTVSGIPETKYAKQIWQKSNPCIMATMHGNKVYTNNSNWKMLPSGYGVTMDLPKNTSCMKGYPDQTLYPVPVVALSSYMYYEVQKLQTATINTLNAYGSYQHSISTISFTTSLSFGISSSGLGGVLNFTPTVSKSFDKMSGTQAYVTGINW